MSNIRVCLAIGRTEVEEWIMKETNKRKMAIEYTQPAPYRDLVLERVSTTMPHIIILAKDLRKSQNSLSFDAIVTKIRTNFKSCRIILLAGDLKPGDDFLKRMVSRGVYDILIGETINLNEIIDCIEHPKDYGYAEALQGLEPVSSDENMSIDISLPPQIEPRRSVFQRSASLPSPAPAPELARTRPEPEAEQIFKDVSEDNGTNVLSSPIPQISKPAPPPEPVYQEQWVPRGIIFEKVADIKKQQPVQNYNQNYNQNYAANINYPANNPQTSAPAYTPEPEMHKGRVNQSSYPVTNNRVLTAEDRMNVGGPKPLSTGYMPRVTLFVGARQGVGCTTTIINTAYQLAMSGKRVVVLDAVWNEKCIFDRLGLRHESTGFNNRGGDLPSGFVGSHYKTFSDKSGKIIGAIQFLELQTGNFPEDSNVIATISKLSGYDNILIDASISIINETLVGLASLADRIVAVTLQDGYELMCLRNYLNVYQTKTQMYSKMLLLINRCNPKLSPTVNDTAKYIIANDIIVVPSDTNGYIRANAEKRNYIGKKKVTNAYNFLITRL